MRHDLPDVYDDRPLRSDGRPPRKRVWPWLLLVFVVAAGAAYWTSEYWLRYLPRRQPAIQTPPMPPARVRPPKDQAAAMSILRRRLTETAKNDCIAILGAGADGSSYFFSAFNRCDKSSLGRWKVNRKTGAVAHQ